ncbi:hypothetical protein POTOM_006782 [Populus tomentosa]|uniref:Uncharacterized protein n=1 Tax=Populus tomentosa TaxID=118781 RepID=A0A8X8DG21_POPTO|nr:hypothetical protein POTOM_006782 [Populus tomentosa]
MKTPERWRWFLEKMKMETVSGKYEDEDGIDLEYTFKPMKQRIKEDGIYLITGLPSRVAGVLVISTVAVWKTGTSYYNTILISPSRTFMLVLLANLIVVLHPHPHPHLPFHLLF